MKDGKLPDARAAAAVWRRVAPSLTPYPEAERAPVQTAAAGAGAAETLALAIRQESEAERAYRAMARRMGGDPGQTLRGLQSAAAGRARALRGFYYMETGEAPEREEASGEERPAWGLFLRRRYRAALELAQRYERQAQSGKDACLSAALERMAAEHRREAETLMTLLQRTLAL